MLQNSQFHDFGKTSSPIASGKVRYPLVDASSHALDSVSALLHRFSVGENGSAQELRDKLEERRVREGRSPLGVCVALLPSLAGLIVLHTAHAALRKLHGVAVR